MMWRDFPRFSVYPTKAHLVCGTRNAETSSPGPFKCSGIQNTYLNPRTEIPLLPFLRDVVVFFCGLMGDPVVKNSDLPDEPPPFLGTWTRVYTGVLLYLLVLIAILYVLSRLWAA